VERPQVQLLATELKFRLEMAFRSGTEVTAQRLPTANVIEPEDQVELAGTSCKGANVC
jgi:hypothetical protein